MKKFPIILLIYVLLAIIPIHTFFYSPGVLGLRHDWSIPPYPEQLKERLIEGLYTWNDISSVSNAIYNTVLYYRLFEYIISTAVDFNGDVLSKVIPAIFMVLSALTMYFLGKTLRFSEQASFSMGLFYMLTPLLYNRVIAGYHLYNFSYALAPLFFVFLNKYVSDRKSRYLISSSIILGVSAVQIQFPFMLFFMGLLYMLIRYPNIGKKNLIAVSIILVSITILLNFFWIAPLLTGSQNIAMIASEEAPLSYHEIQHATRISTAFLMIGYSHVYDPYYMYRNNELPVLIIYSLSALAVISITGVILNFNKKENKTIILYSMLLLIFGLLFVSAVNGPLPELWKILYINIPLISVFREVYHSMFVVVFAYTLLIGSFINGIEDKSKKIFRNSFLVIILILILLMGYPILNSYMHQLQILNYSEEDTKTYNFLKDDPNICRVMYIPSIAPIKYSNLKNPSVDLTIKYSPKPTFAQHITGKERKPLNNIMQYYIINTIANPNELNNLNKLMGNLCTKYIICRFNYTSCYPYYIPMQKYLEEIYRNTSLYTNWLNTNWICHNIEKSSGVTSIERFNNTEIILINNSSPIISVKFSPLLTSSFSKLITLASLLSKNNAVFLMSNMLQANSLLNNSVNIVLMDENPTNLYINSIRNTKFIIPISPYSRPDTNWASDLNSWYIHPLLPLTNIYRGNVVLTWSNPKPESDNPSIYKLKVREWTFSNYKDIDEWKNYTKENQFNAIQRVLLDKKKRSMRVELYNSTWGWKTIQSPLIPINTTSVYRISFRIKGENAHGVHAYIEEYDSNRTLNKNYYLYYPPFGSGGFNWKTINIDYYPQSEGTRYIQLQIWHGHETDEPLPNILWIDDVKVYNITKYVKPVSLDIPFTVDKDNIYKFFIQYLEASVGGEIRVYLDDKEVVLDTKDQLDRFNWKDLGTFYLRKGQHEIVLENLKGFNAVNSFAIAPAERYRESKVMIDKLLLNKTLIYLLNGVKDLYRKEAIVNNLGLIEFGEGGKAWQNINITKRGTYKLGIRGYGKFRINIGNNSFLLNLNQSNFTYSIPFILDSRTYKLEIIPFIHNLVRNPSFEYIINGETQNWSVNSINFEIEFDKGFKDNYSLKVSTATYRSKAWSWIRSEPIDVKPGGRYRVVSHVKYYNVNASHIKLEAYYPRENKWKQLTPFIPGGLTGTSNWQEYSNILGIPDNATKIRVVLNAGWVLNESQGEAITWFDDIEVIPLGEAPKLDTVWLYSTDTNQTIEELFETNETPANVTSYEKINPTLWKVEINNATKPFMLSFAEAYDPLWEARVYSDDSDGKSRLVEKVKPIPLYGVINGFWINETGNLTVEIRYTPQDWFEIGLVISGLTFIGSIGYLVYDWKKRFRWKEFLESLRNREYIKYYKPLYISREIKILLKSHMPYILVTTLIILSHLMLRSNLLLVSIVYIALIPIFITLKFDGKIPIYYAILLFMITAILLLYRNSELANQMIIYAFWLLVVGILCSMIEYFRKTGKRIRFSRYR